MVWRMALEAKLKVFLDRAPVIRITQGVAHVLDDGSGVAIDRAMSLESLRVYVERGRRALARYENGELDVTEQL